MSSTRPTRPGTSSSFAPVESRSSSNKLAPGDRVEAKCRGWTKFFKGTIKRANSDGTFDITFDDGEQVRGVLALQIKGGSQASAAPAQASPPGLAVDSKVEAKVKDWRQFYSGKITKCNADGSFDITDLRLLLCLQNDVEVLRLIAWTSTFSQ